MIHSAIYSLLSSDSTIVSGVGTKIEPLIVPPKTTLPVITYAVGPDMEHQTLDGAVAKESIVKVEVHDTDYHRAETLADAVEVCLSGVRATIGSVRVMRSVMTRRESTFDSTEAGHYRVSADFLFMYV